ncbi:MAG: hypothetical protein AAFY29_21025 [Pseudomonadota bacterium]
MAPTKYSGLSAARLRGQTKHKSSVDRTHYLKGRGTLSRWIAKPRNGINPTLDQQFDGKCHSHRTITKAQGRDDAPWSTTTVETLRQPHKRRHFFLAGTVRKGSHELLEKQRMRTGIAITEGSLMIGERRRVLFIRDPDGNVLKFDELLATSSSQPPL